MTDEQQLVYDSISRRLLSTNTGRPLLVAINGKDASGKTTMADILAGHLRTQTTRSVVRISVDDFMNERAIRYTVDESPARGCYNHTFNFDGLISQTLAPLRRAGLRQYKEKIFDHASDTPLSLPSKVADKDAIVIFDGVFLYKHDLVDYWDVKILLETDDEVAIERGARRDADRIGSYEEARQKYIDRYIASQQIYYTEERPELVADVIIDNNNIDKPSIVS